MLSKRSIICVFLTFYQFYETNLKLYQFNEKINYDICVGEMVKVDIFLECCSDIVCKQIQKHIWCISNW